MFEPLKNIRPFLKMAFEGFAGDGKTFTATQVAIGLHKAIGSKKPIAILDTEQASKALIPLFNAANVEPIVSNSRALAAVIKAIEYCEKGGADILIIDSITHIWEDFLENYKASKKYNRTFLEFADWGVIKPRWKREFSTPFVNAKCHIIFTGRAGYEYDFHEQVDGATGKVKKEIHKSGIKMKAEGETAFEPDILILMEKCQDLLSEKKSIYREATIVKDRTNIIDGQTFKNPKYADFEPAIKILLDGVCGNSNMNEIVDKFDHETDSTENRKIKEAILASIGGQFELMRLGTGKEEKGYKAAILKAFTGKTSIEEIALLPMETIRLSADKIRRVADCYAGYLDECERNATAPQLSKIQECVAAQKDDLPM